MEGKGLSDLEIYQLAIKLSELTWIVYIRLPKNLKFSIGNQTLDSIDSVGANIAEGFGRFHYRDSVKFYYNARGSLFESKHWFYLFMKRDLLIDNEYNDFLNISKTLGIKLNNFITTIKKKIDDN